MSTHSAHLHNTPQQTCLLRAPHVISTHTVLRPIIDNVSPSHLTDIHVTLPLHGSPHHHRCHPLCHLLAYSIVPRDALSPFSIFISLCSFPSAFGRLFSILMPHPECI